MRLARHASHLTPLLFISTTTFFLFAPPSTCKGLLLTFQIQTGKHLSNFQNINDYVSHYVKNTLECSRLCSDDQICQAFYLFKATDGNEIPGRSNCTLISELVKEEHVTNGTGTYGFLWEMLSPRPQAVPNIKYGVFVKVEKNLHGSTAVYACHDPSSNSTSVSLLYNSESNAWPTMNTMCLDSVCSVSGLSNTLLRIGQEEAAYGDYTADVICPQGETHHSDVICVKNTGAWSFTSGHLLVGCVSTTCWRYNGYKIIYAGNKSESVAGITCQRWDAQTPRRHGQTANRFNADGYSLENAVNYCRDPDNYTRLWCYQMTGKWWELCDIPDC